MMKLKSRKKRRKNPNLKTRNQSSIESKKIQARRQKKFKDLNMNPISPKESNLATKILKKMLSPQRNNPQDQIRLRIKQLNRRKKHRP